MKFIGFISVQLILVAILALGAWSQAPSREEAIKAYNSGNYVESIKIFKEVTKQAPLDFDAWYRLGLSYFLHEKPKDATKSVEKAVKLAPDKPHYQAFLAYLYLFNRDSRAEKTARSVLLIDKDNSQANFVLAVLSMRSDSYAEAVNFARLATRGRQPFQLVHRVKSQALIALFASEPYPPKREPETRTAMFDEAVADLEKYLTFDTDGSATAELGSYLEAMRYFADYYRIPGNLNPAGETDLTLDPTEVKLRITKKTSPSYTDSARKADIRGTVTLIVQFRKDGRIGHIIVGKPLEDSLDKAAVEAAKKIKFVPGSRNGVPISVVKRLEYSFDIR